jgi:adenosine deaminase
MERMTYDWVQALPKIDLHTHLDGSMRLSTVKALAKKLPKERRFPRGFSIEKAIIPPDRCSLETYLGSFDVTVAVLQSAAALERAAFELCEDAAKENVIYLEVRFAPLLHLVEEMSPREVVESVLRGLARGEEEHGLHTGLILCALRNESSERSLEVAQLAAQFRNKGVVAFDLAGPERDHPPYLHRTAIGFARDADVHITLHAGEGCCPEQIREALDFGAERIGHGVYLFQDAKTESRVVEEGIPLETCPTSNLQISGIIEDYADHPLKRYLDLGIPVTVNTDNRLMSNTTCTDELSRVIEALSLSRDEVRRILRDSAAAAFAPDALRAELTETIDAAFRASS